MSDHPVVHFEMPYDDGARAAAFYRKAFGWDIQEYGPDMGNYIVLGTAPSEDGRPTEPGTINGGVYPRQAGAPAPGVTVGCADITASVQRVADAGGTVHGEPMEIPGVGLYVAFTDTEGNAMSLLQPNR
jgi:predicted enzyme related to lactoylglutathione lyase